MPAAVASPAGGAVAPIASSEGSVNITGGETGFVPRAGGDASAVKPVVAPFKPLTAPTAQKRYDTAPPAWRKPARPEATPSRPQRDRPPAMVQYPPPPTSEVSQAPAQVMQAEPGESWPAFLERCSARTSVFTNDPAKIFDAFRTTDDLALAYACFAQLFHKATTAQGGGGAEAPWASSQARRFPYEAIRVLLGGNWKAKQLWVKLDARIKRVY